MIGSSLSRKESEKDDFANNYLNYNSFSLIQATHCGKKVLMNSLFE